MLVPVVTSPVARTSSVKRVRRRAAPDGDLPSTPEEGPPVVRPAGDTRPTIAVPGADSPLARASPAVLVALGRLRLGG